MLERSAVALLLVTAVLIIIRVWYTSRRLRSQINRVEKDRDTARLQLREAERKRDRAEKVLWRSEEEARSLRLIVDSTCSMPGKAYVCDLAGRVQFPRPDAGSALPKDLKELAAAFELRPDRLIAAVKSGWNERDRGVGPQPTRLTDARGIPVLVRIARPHSERFIISLTKEREQTTDIVFNGIRGLHKELSPIARDLGLGWIQVSDGAIRNHGGLVHTRCEGKTLDSVLTIPRGTPSPGRPVRGELHTTNPPMQVTCQVHRGPDRSQRIWVIDGKRSPDVSLTTADPARMAHLERVASWTHRALSGIDMQVGLLNQSGLPAEVQEAARHLQTRIERVRWIERVHEAARSGLRATKPCLYVSDMLGLVASEWRKRCNSTTPYELIYRQAPPTGSASASQIRILQRLLNDVLLHTFLTPTSSTGTQITATMSESPTNLCIHLDGPPEIFEGTDRIGHENNAKMRGARIKTDPDACRLTMSIPAAVGRS